MAAAAAALARALGDIIESTHERVIAAIGIDMPHHRALAGLATRADFDRRGVERVDAAFEAMAAGSASSSNTDSSNPIRVNLSHSLVRVTT